MQKTMLQVCWLMVEEVRTEAEGFLLRPREKRLSKNKMRKAGAVSAA